MLAHDGGPPVRLEFINVTSYAKKLMDDPKFKDRKYDVHLPVGFTRAHLQWNVPPSTRPIRKR